VSAPDPRVALFGSVVRRVRRDRQLSQDAVALRGGLHVNQLGRLERGTHDVYLSTVYRVAEGLGMPVGELMSMLDDELRERG